MTKKLSKQGRKRSNVKKEIKIPKAAPTPIIQMEANMFQQIIQISNQFAKLKKQYEEVSTIVAELKQRREKIQKGDIKMPIFMPLSRNMFYNESDKKIVLADLDNQIKMMTTSRKGVEGQLLQHQDAYIEAGLGIENFLKNKFSAYKPKNVYTGGCNPAKEETVLFEGELDSDLKIEEAKEACTEACKRNCKKGN